MVRVSLSKILIRDMAFVIWNPTGVYHRLWKVSKFKSNAIIRICSLTVFVLFQALIVMHIVNDFIAKTIIIVIKV